MAVTTSVGLAATPAFAATGTADPTTASGSAADGSAVTSQPTKVKSKRVGAKASPSASASPRDAKKKSKPAPSASASADASAKSGRATGTASAVTSAPAASRQQNQVKAAAVPQGKATTEATAPDSASATSPSAGVIRVSWTDTSGQTDVTYHAKATAVPPSAGGTASCDSTGTTCDITGVAPGTYSVVVNATDNASGGTTSGDTSPVNVTVVPAKPTGVTGSVSGSTITVKYTQSETGVKVTGEVHPTGGAAGSPVDCSAGTCTFTGLAMGTYDATVWAEEAADPNNASTAATATSLGVAPAAPTSATGTISNGAMTIAYSGGDATGVTVKAEAHKKGSTAPGTPVVCSGGTCPAITGLTAGTYDATVWAEESANSANASDPVPATVAGNPVKPGDPQSVTAAVNGSTITVSYTDNEPGVTVMAQATTMANATGTPVACANGTCTIPDLAPGSYDVTVWAEETGNSANASNKVSVTVTGNPVPVVAPSIGPSNDGTALTVAYHDTQAGVTVKAHAYPAGTATGGADLTCANDMCSVSDLAPGSYDVVVWAEETGSTPVNKSTVVPVGTLTMGVLKPVVLGYDTTGTTLAVGYTVSQPGVVVKAEVSSAGSTTATPAAMDCADGVCTVSDLMPGRYDVRVWAEEDGDATNASESVTLTGIGVALGPPTAPTGVTGTPGDNSITVSWTAPTGGGDVTGYTVTATAAGYPTRSCPGTVTESPCTISDLAAGVAYTLHVVAVGADGNSPEATGTPTAPPTGTPMAPSAVPAGAVSVGSVTVAAGGKVTFTASGFMPGSTVVLTLFSTPVDLGTATVAADGTVTATVSLPAGLTGTHTLLATGLAADGTVRYVTESVTITASGTAGGLPVTGTDVNRVALTAFALLMLGLAMVAVTDERIARRLRRVVVTD